MVDQHNEVLKKIHRFLEEANKRLNISKVILYGSQMTGQASEWSDIDLAVVSSDFKGMSFVERAIVLGKIAWTAGTSEIEAVGFTAEELEAATELDFAWEIKRTGRIVA